MKSLIVGNANQKIDNIAAAQLTPFFRHRAQLERHLGFKFSHIQAVSMDEIEQACQAIPSDVEVLFIRPDWREQPDRVVQLIKSIRESHGNLKIFFIDPWDQVSSRFFGVLPYVNKLLKYQRLKHLDHYQKPLVGGTMITDYLVREQGFDLGDWHVGSPIPAGYEDRIATGWSMVLQDKFEKMLFQPLMWRLKNRRLRRTPKNIDVFCHVSYDSIHDQDNWYTKYRMGSIAAVKQLGAKYRLAVSGEFPEHRTISKQQYQDEIRRSRIVFSPFGWGELTWRDYEAVCHDCLLLKPSVEHIDSSPHIYYPGETYVPLKWDFSDLEEKCTYYLQNPDEAARIITNARRVLETYFTQDGFVQAIAQLLTGETMPTAPVMSSPLPNSVTSLAV